MLSLELNFVDRSLKNDFRLTKKDISLIDERRFEGVKRTARDVRRLVSSLGAAEPRCRALVAARVKSNVRLHYVASAKRERRERETRSARHKPGDFISHRRSGHFYDGRGDNYTT